MMASLQHCLTLFHQQEDVRVLQLRQEQEKCRVLEEALNVLAKEHHELEKSVVMHISETGTIPRSFSCKTSRIYDTDDEFYDAFAEDSDTDTIVQSESIFNTPSGSVLTLFEESNGVAMTNYGGDRGERRQRSRRRRSLGQGSGDMLSRRTSSSNTLNHDQYFPDEMSKTEPTTSTGSSSTSSEASPSSSSSSSSSSSESVTNVTSHESQSTSSYYTQQCEAGQHGEEHCLVVASQDDDGSSDKSGSNSSSDTLVGSGMSNATSCATLVSEGGHVYQCARSEVFGRSSRSAKERDLICLKTPVHRR